MVISVPRILLPKDTDWTKWATVACDQFCAEPGYWKELDAFAGNFPSTLRLIYPEIYLHENRTERIRAIHETMDAYLRQGIFSEVEGFVLVERQVGGETRLGLMLQIDLECYDWKRVRVPVRATEDTIMERIPVRVEIRRHAPMEFPHTLLLMDDPQKEIIEPLFAKRASLKKLYDFELNMEGGHIRGYLVEDTAEVIKKIEKLEDPAIQAAKYGTDAGIVFAVGDGNHSIATAKVLWEDIKKGLSPDEQKTHPARYFLTEAVNLYGGGMDFEPIHRVVFGGGEAVEDMLKNALSGEGTITLVTKTGEKKISAPVKPSAAIAETQRCIEKLLQMYPELSVEYVHNEKRLRDVVRETGGTGIIMPKFKREELFDYVVNVGNLPKKAFSVGEPEHKRYYLEGKRIIKN